MFSLRILPIVFALLGLIVYSNTFHNSFHFDDFWNIISNPLIRDIHNLHHIWLCGPPTRFITYLSLALNYQCNGLGVVGYHIFNFMVHMSAAAFVWWVVSLIFQTPLIIKEKIAAHALWISFFTASIFLVHPIQTQPVNYIIQRAVLLASFFYLLSVGLYLKARLAQESAHRFSGFYYTASLGAAVAAMFCKEMAVSLPLMICFCEFFLFKGDYSRRWKMATAFFPAVLIVLLPWMKTNVKGYAGETTAWAFFLTQLKVKVIYLRLLIIPIHQSIDYVYPLVKSPFEWGVVLSGLFLVLLLLAGVYLRNNYRLLSVGIFWFFITLLPESGFIPISDVIVEHRVYLATMGFGLFLSSGLFYLFQNRSSLAVRVLCLVVIGYSVMTYQRNKIWHDEFTLWNDVVQHFPQNQRAYLNRGAAYQKNGDLDHALADYNMVIGLGPVDAVTLSNRGNIFTTKGYYDIALANFNLAIKINPSYVGSYINRARLYEIEGKNEQAAADFATIHHLSP